eukprot:Pgem_evm1s16591
MSFLNDDFDNNPEWLHTPTGKNNVFTYSNNPKNDINTNTKYNFENLTNQFQNDFNGIEKDENDDEDKPFESSKRKRGE